MAVLKNIVLAFLLLTTAQAWSAAGWGKPGNRRDTNANRFARGLSPLPPRRLYEATRVGPPLARRSVYFLCSPTKSGAG
ncbi:hypothetical protein DACRYDRAFT_23978 [Dacryopinax primogenitus]|uniref:Uncharacterized protein n=1 Tax=Dacryopinax primogenitus (strain DJM 731) TaxID=1858805 RepID=M5FR00_DACPD|nr:uncharacterized protein DACRYDRAFT_23978 [Dacryopinax primogenitus]EJT99455.1 hypothetical protein DACRYDRAFT_23978 [Dacryopinax primogenitus]